MNTRSELFVYTVLIALAALLSFLLVRNVLSASAERDRMKEGVIIEKDEAKMEGAKPTPLAVAIAVFQESNLFTDLNPLLPTRTRVIVPTPTPTIVPLCTGWQVPFISAGKLAQIRFTDKRAKPYRVGDTIPKDPAVLPDYKLIKIEKDRVAILRMSDGEWCWLMKDGGAERMEGPPPK